MELVTCAFCGVLIEVAFAVTLVAYRSMDESQTLYCHGTCLAERLHPSIPLHPGFEDA